MSQSGEKRTCQNCQNEFLIEPEDFSFYQKIQVPPPTWCPECRLVRRLIWRNERELYKRKCDKCEKSIISIYPEVYVFPVYCRDCWLGDQWDPTTYGQAYDLGKNFFEQWLELFHKVPLQCLFIGGMRVNSDYTNLSADNRDCYLIFGGKDNEHVYYSKNVVLCKNSLDILSGVNLELCNGNTDCEKSYRLFFSRQCENCTDSAFLYDCRNCQNCFGCTNLRNKSYCIWNEQYTREKYLKMMEEFNIGSYENLQKLSDKFSGLTERAIHKFARFINVKDSTGDNLRNARNCKNCFEIFGSGSENSKYTHWVVQNVKDSYDNYGMNMAERVYETTAIGFDQLENSDYKFDFLVKGSNRAEYSYNCTNCSDIFGCIGLRNKQCCILNKQYSKEEYEKLVLEIKSSMNEKPFTDVSGRVYQYGEFFPPEFSPFAYNETIAQEYFPLTREKAVSHGYKWKERAGRNYKIDIEAKDLPDDIKNAPDDIVGKAIGCAHQGDCNEQCTEAFKIIPDELAFYRRMNLTLPRLCPNCRHYERQKQRNPMRLWHRKCMNVGCPNEFETSYAPDRPEKVYCESCYNKEVY